MALRRCRTTENNLLDYIPKGITMLPNTSGARNAEEAVRIARLAREVCQTDFVKVEIEHEAKYLLPDNEETIKATKQLAKEGFVVMPYMFPDPIAAKRLEDAGAACVMPLGAMIGSNKGLRARDFIEVIIKNSNVPVIIDAGIGRPSQAAEAMEMGADAVMAYTAIVFVWLGQGYGRSCRAVQPNERGRLHRLKCAESHNGDSRKDHTEKGRLPNVCDALTFGRRPLLVSCVTRKRYRCKASLRSRFWNRSCSKQSAKSNRRSQNQSCPPTGTT